MLSKRQTINKEYVDGIEFDTFDPTEDIPTDATITVVGRRRSGKSKLMKALVYAMRKKISKAYICSYTAKSSLGFLDFIPEENRIHGVDEARLQSIMDDQQEIFNAEEAKGNKDKTKMPYVLIIFDDIINSTTGVRGSNLISYIYANGRHYNVLSILNVQSFKSVNPLCRENTDVSIAFKFKNEDTVDDFVKENFHVDNMDTGRRIFNAITQDPKEPYQCLVVLTHKLTSPILKYTASIGLPDFVIEDKKDKTPKLSKKVANLYKKDRQPLTHKLKPKDMFNFKFYDPDLE